MTGSRAPSPMRAWVLAVVLLAGCLGEEAPAPPASPTPATPSEPTPAPVTPAPEPTPEPTVPSGTPPPPPPRVVFERTFDFSTEGDPTGQDPESFDSQNVGEEYSRISANVTFARTSTGPTQLPVSGTVHATRVRIFDPEGEEILQASSETPSKVETFPSKIGAYTVRFEGAGTFRATVVLTASS